MPQRWAFLAALGRQYDRDGGGAIASINNKVDPAIVWEVMPSRAADFGVIRLDWPGCLPTFWPVAPLHRANEANMRSRKINRNFKTDLFLSVFMVNSIPLVLPS